MSFELPDFLAGSVPVSSRPGNLNLPPPIQQIPERKQPIKQPQVNLIPAIRSQDPIKPRENALPPVLEPVLPVKNIENIKKSTRKRPKSLGRTLSARSRGVNDFVFLPDTVTRQRAPLIRAINQNIIQQFV